MRAAIFAALSTVALFPSAAFAQQACEQHNNQVTGTVVGTIAGGLLGNAVAGHGDKKSGAIIGALGGAIIGNQIGKGSRTIDCQHAYGFYDTQGQYHANNVDRTVAQGYYDRDGRWIDGTPNGYYDTRGTWVNYTTDMRAGYYDDYGRWVPPSVNGYYDPNNRWIAVTNTAPVRGGGYNNWDRPRDVRAQEDWLRDRIRRAEDNGDISHREARNFMSELQDISAREARMPRRYGVLNNRDEDYIRARLDNLSDDIRREVRS